MSQASVRRVGYPLLPNFGGTFHSFTGTTLDAAVVDLLPMTKRVDNKQVPPAYPEHCGRYTSPHKSVAAAVRGPVARAPRRRSDPGAGFQPAALSTGPADRSRRIDESAARSVGPSRSQRRMDTLGEGSSRESARQHLHAVAVRRLQQGPAAGAVCSAATRCAPTEHDVVCSRSAAAHGTLASLRGLP